MLDRITTQSRPLDVLITSVHELHLIKKIEIMDTISNMQLDDPNSKPHGGKSIINFIDLSIIARFYPSQGPEHYKLLCLDQFHGLYNINCDQDKKSDIRMMK